MAPSSAHRPDLDEVVGEDPVSAPDPGSVDAVKAAAVPSVAMLERADSAFGSGAPLDQSSERSLVFEFSSTL